MEAVLILGLYRGDTGTMEKKVEAPFFGFRVQGT